jgi:hypothetical protein
MPKDPKMLLRRLEILDGRLEAIGRVNANAELYPDVHAYIGEIYGGFHDERIEEVGTEGDVR